MYLLAKFGSHGSYGNGDINSYISSCRTTLEKGNSPASVHDIERFSKSEIRIYNSKIPDTVGRKREGEGEEHRQLQNIMRITRTQ